MEQQNTFWGTMHDSKRSKQQESGANQTKKKQPTLKHAGEHHHSCVSFDNSGSRTCGAIRSQKTNYFCDWETTKKSHTASPSPVRKNFPFLCSMFAPLGSKNVPRFGVIFRPRFWGHFPSPLYCLLKENGN